MTTVKQISEAEFSEAVLGSSIPVLVDFGSKTCGVCLANAPAVANVATEYDGEVAVVKVDVEVSPGVAATYGVRTLPTLLMFRDGEVTGKLMGHLTRSALAQFIEKQVGAGA